MQPWFHETPGPALFNEWTITHVLWGMAAVRFLGFWPALGLHTFYEMIEGRIFPDPHRDVSTLNHAGDTMAFAVGYWMGSR